MPSLTIKQVKNEIEELADRIDNYLAELEHKGKDNTTNYDHLLFIAGGLRELLESEF